MYCLFHWNQGCNSRHTYLNFHAWKKDEINTITFHGTEAQSNYLEQIITYLFWGPNCLSFDVLRMKSQNTTNQITINKYKLSTCTKKKLHIGTVEQDLKSVSTKITSEKNMIWALKMIWELNERNNTWLHRENINW